MIMLYMLRSLTRCLGSAEGHRTPRNAARKKHANLKSCLVDFVSRSELKTRETFGEHGILLAMGTRGFCNSKGQLQPPAST